VRILFSTTRGAGHFGPLVPFAQACVRAGHDVVVAGPESGAAMVEEAGLAFRGFADPPMEEVGPILGRAMSLSRDDANALVVGQVFGRIDVRAALPGLREAFAELRPEVVVRDPAEYGSAVVAGERGVPAARAATCMAFAEELCLGWSGPELEPLSKGIVDRIRATPWLTVVPESLEDPDRPAPARIHRFRETGDAVAATEDGPLVYVSFGSVAPTMGFFPSLYRAAIDALAEVGLPVLVTVGRDADPAELGPLPDDVRVERWVPQREVMPAAAAMVGHGGFGSTLLAAVCGVPQIVVPLFADQHFNGERVEAAGAGLALDGPGAVGAELAGAVRRLVDEPAFRKAAEGLTREAAALPPVDDAVRVLDLVARGGS
jgi:UDP:flavonoid glycosyltransferase YjiC (YdhE family)